jgi:virginiamycin B lyase
MVQIIMKRSWEKLRTRLGTSKKTASGVLMAALAVPLLAAPLAAAATTVIITQYPIPTQGANSEDATTGPDGAMWFSELSAGKIGRTTTAGVTTEYTIPTTGSQPHGITTGPDGALWFAESGSNKIGRIDTGGTITEYTIPHGQPMDVVTGPDGALWYCDWQYGFGRIDTSTGAITEYSTQDQFHNAPQMRSLTVGSDGAIWGVSDSRNELDRVTTGGTVTRYPLTTFSGAYDVTNGPDGALWLTSYTSGNIGRFDVTSDLLTNSFPTDEANQNSQITTGPDGALWFTETTAGKIGRLTTAGAATSYLVPGRVSPYGITLGSDGALWFTEYGGNNVGRATVSLAPVVHITNPAASSTVSGTVNITGTIDANSAYNVQLYVFNSASQAVVGKYNYAVPNSTTAYSYSWDTTAVPNGNYTINLSARDAQGRKDANSTSVVHVTVQN